MVDAKTLLTSEFSCEHDASADDYTVRWMLPDNRMLSLVVSKAGIITCVVSPFSEAAPPVQMHVSDLATLSLAGEDAEGLCAKADDTLQAMAALASVPMDLWGRHSNAVLELIAQVRSLSLRVEAEKRAREEAAAIAKDLADRGYSGDAIAAALRSRT